MVSLHTRDERLRQAFEEQFEQVDGFALERASEATTCDFMIADGPGADEITLRPCAGEDVTLRRPLRFSDLLNRLRGAGEAVGEDRRGRSRFDPVARTFVCDDGSVRRLTEKEAAVVALLIAAGEAGATREELLNVVWDYRAQVDTHTVETHIYRLRRKLEGNPMSPQCILTTPRGYRLS